MIDDPARHPDPAPEAPSPQRTGSGADDPAGAPDEASAGSPPSLEEQLAGARAEVARLTDAWMRARAEIENVRRTAQAETAKAHKFAVESFAESLLPVVDSLEASLAAPEVDPQTLRSGVELTLKQLVAALERARVVEIAPAGERFDPNLHQAMTAVESDQPPNTVVQVFQKGYLLHERVLRPALVSVAKPGSAPGVESGGQ